MQGLNKFGISIPEIYLPRAGVDLTKWSVVACDQFSSWEEYWRGVAKLVGDSPSTLNLIYPEVYLHAPDKAERIAKIQSTMREYLQNNVLQNIGAGLVLVERKFSHGKDARLGLLVALDLEKYSYEKNSKSLIRPTEATIIERLPPRMEIRRASWFELPHIIVLIDDPHNNVIAPLHQARAHFKKLYDFALMSDAGSIEAWQVTQEKYFEQIAGALANIFEVTHEQFPLLFAVGDGNHSLAAAKAIWEEIKTKGLSAAEQEQHPNRFVLVEIVNIHDPALPFHPIHRVLFSATVEQLIAYAHQHWTIRILEFSNRDKACEFIDHAQDKHCCALFDGAGKNSVIEFTQTKAGLAVATVQEFLDAFLAEHKASRIDYIHDRAGLDTLCNSKDTVGVYLPPVPKHAFFETIERESIMPRKTFSLGEALEKRFYIEARKII